MKLNLSPKTKSALSIGLALICLFGAWALVGLFAGRWKEEAAKHVAGPALSYRENPTPSPTVAVMSADWVVYITGAVIQPGVYSVPEGSRLHDVVRKAGGLALNADAEAVNLAELVADGAHLHVPRREERPKPAPTEEIVTVSGRVRPEHVASTQEAPRNPSRAEVVNINTASAAELESLPGIGPKTAADIVADREKNGPFASVDDLSRVKGIGPKKLEALKGLVKY